MFNNKEKNEKFYRYVIILSLFLSVLWVTFIKTVPFSDFDYYNKLAKGIALGDQWGDTYTSVGYPIVLGLIYKVFGANIIVAKTFNVLLTLINNIIFLRILNKNNFTDKKKKVIFAIFAFFPSNIFYTSILGSELLYTTILLIITNLYFSTNKTRYIYIGILVGLNTMVKPFFILFSFLIFMVEIICQREFFKSLKNALIVLILSLITISPWIYRNSKLVGQFTFVSNNGGIVLYINNNSQNNSGRWMPIENVENSLAKDETYINANMTEKNKMLSSAAKKWISAHPRKFIGLGFKRLYNTYFWGDDLGYSLNGTAIADSTKIFLFRIYNNIKNLIFLISTIYILSYSAKVIYDLCKKRLYNFTKINIFMLILYYMHTCIYFITEGQGRYSFPMVFVLIICFMNSIDYISNNRIITKYNLKKGNNI